MKNRNEKESSRWLKQAEDDLNAAVWQMKGSFFSHGCFLSQQSGEKALKAYLYARGKRSVMGHSVLELCRMCQTYDSAFKTLEPAAKKLDKYYIITRYPNGLPGFTPSEYFNKKECETAVKHARKIFQFAKEKSGRVQFS